jgi:hypothetical protein
MGIYIVLSSLTYVEMGFAQGLKIIQTVHANAHLTVMMVIQEAVAVK